LIQTESKPEPKKLAVVTNENKVDKNLTDLIADKAQVAGISTTLVSAIAFCESTYRQHDDNGQVLRGKQNSQDVGLFQINEKYHLKTSQSLGFDIYTTEGNIDYALWLIKNQGSYHWKWSQHCWSPKV